MHERTRRALASITAVVLAMTLLYGLSASAQPRGNILTVAIGSYPSTLDPAIGVGGPHYRVFVNTYEGLLAYERGTVKLVPALAQSWSASADLMVYTFRLRSGVKFHDGSVLDAEAVKLSFDRLKKLGLGPAIFLDQVKDVQVVDPLTVRISLKQPSATFPMGLAKVFVHGKSHARDPDNGRAWLAENVNGTGPFKVARLEKGQWIMLQRHSDYWKGWPERRLDGVLIRIIPDAGTQKLMLERGEIDMGTYYSIGPDEHPDNLAKKPGIKVVKSRAFRIFILAMNTQKPNSPLRDKRVRKAVALAFDYEAMKDVFFGNAEVPNGFLPPGFTAHDPKRPQFKRDAAAARRLMADAGFTQGFEIDCRIAQEEEQGRKLGLVVQASLKEIGIKVNLVPNPPFAVLTAELSKLETAPAFGVHRLMSPLTADPGSFIRQVFGSTNAGKPYNDSWYQNAEVERLLDEAERTADEQKRIELWRKAEGIVVDDQPVLFVVFASPVVEPVRERVVNYVYHPLEYSGVFPFYEVSLR